MFPHVPQPTGSPTDHPAAAPTLLRPGETIEDARKRLEAYKARLEATLKRSKELQADLDKIAAERQRINARLEETGKLIQLSEAQLSVTKSRVDELEAQQSPLCAAIEQRHETISALFTAMQQMGRKLPPVPITISCQEDDLNVVIYTLGLASAFPTLTEQASAIGRQIAHFCADAEGSY